MENEIKSRDHPEGENYGELMRYAPAGSSQEQAAKPVCKDFAECKGCPYPAHGFVCWSDRCMRKTIEQIHENKRREYKTASMTERHGGETD